ncbi:hypothetical protein HNR62_001983 [Oceanisphaera litoralis]|uniref:hypothetical protein n=1 Tax=Oceanisphaera litoralis TaxID=225144 RepID=UPI00195DBB79|nr:hypothetical protein [Oceanisphaera litoralis]MBM7456102.1 hypothetical protein [Oceanisphaera litoralis]
MKRVILLSAFLSFSVLAGQELDMIPVADDALLGKSRGMAQLTDQDNITAQGGMVAGNNMIDSVSITGNNAIAAGAFSGSNGIIMVNLTSGNNNLTNMSASVNLYSAK